VRYFIAPRSGEKSHKNYLSTIKHGVPFARIEQFLSQEGKDILGKEETIYAWGNRKGKATEWSRMEKGDTIIFYAHRNLVMSGTVIFKQHSPELALSMWPADENGNPWEYTFFINNLKYFKIPIRFFDSISGYNLNAVMGFLQISEEKKNNVIKNGGFEKLFSDFSDENSTELVKPEEGIYVNVEPEVKPEVFSRNVIARIPTQRTSPTTRRVGYVDFDEVNKNKAYIGSRGEELVLKREKEYLRSINRPDLAEKVKRVSMEDTYSGYDILSFDEKGNEKKIEVKSTSVGKSEEFSFNISPNEINIAKESENYFIYVVYAVKTKNPSIYIISHPFKVESQLYLEPVAFKVHGKFINQ
jgi:hypothetical protein